MRILLFALSLGLAGAGCAHLPLGIEKPSANVEGVAVGSVSFSGVSGELDLSIFNPNGFGVPLENVQWELAIGTASAVSGEFALSQTIPAKAAAPVKAALTIGAADAARVGAQLASGANTYTVRGTLFFATKAGTIQVAFEHTGNLSALASL